MYFASVVNYFSFVVVADLNSDGKDDIIGTGDDVFPETDVAVLIGAGNGKFLAPPEFDADGLDPTRGLVRDLNGDGIPDIAVSGTRLSTDDKVVIYFGKGDGTFSTIGASYATGHIPTELTSGDFNNDRKIDLAARTAKGVSILLGNGDGTFQPYVDYGDSAGYIGGLVVGDFNKDGKLDVALANFQDVGVLLGNGDGTLQPEVHYPTALDEYGITTGDLNGDGNLDLAVTNYEASNISLLFGKGDGTFQPQVSFPTGKGPLGIAAADLNADGKLDLVLGASLDEKVVQVLLGHGDGTFSSPANYPLSNNFAYNIKVADLNGDGKQDILTSGISVLLGNGDGSFQHATDYSTGSRTVAVADLNRDGAFDAVGIGGLVGVYLNTGGTQFKTTATPNPAKQGQPVTLVASLTASVIGQPVPTGTVTFKDGATVLTTMTLRQGRAHFGKSNFTAGTHTITVIYSGDSHFNPNTAKAITLVVTQ